MKKAILALGLLAGAGCACATATESVIANFSGVISGFNQLGVFQTVSTTSAQAGTRYTTSNGVSMLIYGSASYPQAKYTGSDLYLRTNAWNFSQMTAGMSGDFSFVGAAAPVTYSMTITAINSTSPKNIALYLGGSATIDAATPFRLLANSIGVLLAYNTTTSLYDVMLLDKIGKVNYDIDSPYIGTQSIGSIAAADILNNELAFSISNNIDGSATISVSIGDIDFGDYNLLATTVQLYDQDSLTLYTLAQVGNANTYMEVALSNMGVVIPEPAMATLLLGALALAAGIRRRRAA